MIFELHPPQAAGPLRIGATEHDNTELLKQLGTLTVLCGINGRRHGWGVHRPSGLFIGAFFDSDDCLEAIEFGRPAGNGDAITYDGLNVFTTPAADLVAQLRQHAIINVESEE